MGISEKRKQHIRESIKNSGNVTVSTLADELSVSEMTIRRDLRITSYNVCYTKLLRFSL